MIFEGLGHKNQYMDKIAELNHLKILLISNMYPSKKKPYWGTFVKEQAICLKRAGCKICVVGDRGEGSDIISVILKYSCLLFRALFATLRFKPNIIHSHYIFPTGVIGLICSPLYNSHHVITSHRGDIFEMPFRSRVHFYFTKLCLMKAHRIIAVSEEIRNKMIKEFNVAQNKIHVIDMGVKITKLNKKKRDRNIFDDNKPIRILFIGISFFRKGGNTILKSAEIIKRSISRKFYILFIGEKPNGIDTELKLRGLYHNIRFLGFLTHDKTLKIISNSDIFILPSRSEGLPIAMLEAMSFHLPVIVTPVGDIPKVVKNLYNGLFVPYGDEISLANALIKLTSNYVLYNKLSQGAFNTSKKYSSYNKSLEVIKVYKTVV